MRSFLVTLLIWGAVFAPLWYVFHGLFYPPGDWIGALIASFTIALGIGALRKARLERRDAALVARPEGPPRDGERVAIAGTLEPLEAVLKAPFSGEECVLYDYEISHIPELPPFVGKPRNQNSRPAPVVDHSGVAMAPVVLRSGIRDVRLLAYPGVEGFPWPKLDDKARERARGYIRATTFEEQSILDVPRQIKKVMEDRSGHLRVDWKTGSHDLLESSRLEERRVPPGARACVIGLYSAKDNAIVPQDNVGGTRLIRGTREEALSFVRDKGAGSIIAAVLFIAIPTPITYGILTLQERSEEAHHHPTVRAERMEAFHRAANQGDLVTLRAALKRGADVNEPDADGYPALAHATRVDIAAALLDAGAKIDARDRDGFTPLMMAARDGSADLVRLLIARHADLGAQDPSKKTALDLALENDRQEVAKILRDAGGH